VSFKVLKNALFFAAPTRAMGAALAFGRDAGGHGQGEGYPAGLPGPRLWSPPELTVVGDTLFFKAWGGTSDNGLWKTDGTPEGTVKVKDLQDFCSYEGYYCLRELTVAGDLLIFQGGERDGALGSDGTTEGTFL